MKYQPDSVRDFVFQMHYTFLNRCLSLWDFHWRSFSNQMLFLCHPLQKNASLRQKNQSALKLQYLSTFSLSENYGCSICKCSLNQINFFFEYFNGINNIFFDTSQNTICPYDRKVPKQFSHHPIFWVVMISLAVYCWILRLTFYISF